MSYSAASNTVWFRLYADSGPPPGMPDIPGVEYGLARGPACGDLYDVFEAAPGHWRFAIGGVRGTGPEAATAIDLTRHGPRLLAAEGHGVAVLTRLNRALVREDPHGRPMRLLHGELVHRPDTGVRLTLVSAGHPPPLRLTPGGAATPVTGGQPSLGGVGDLRFSEETLDLDPGDALLCTSEPPRCPDGDETLSKLLTSGLRADAPADASAALLLRVL